MIEGTKFAFLIEPSGHSFFLVDGQVACSGPTIYQRGPFRAVIELHTDGMYAHWNRSAQPSEETMHALQGPTSVAADHLSPEQSGGRRVSVRQRRGSAVTVVPSLTFRAPVNTSKPVEIVRDGSVAKCLAVEPPAIVVSEHRLGPCMFGPTPGCVQFALKLTAPQAPIKMTFGVTGYDCQKKTLPTEMKEYQPQWLVRSDGKAFQPKKGWFSAG